MKIDSVCVLPNGSPVPSYIVLNKVDSFYDRPNEKHFEAENLKITDENNRIIFNQQNLNEINVFENDQLFESEKLNCINLQDRDTRTITLTNTTMDETQKLFKLNSNTTIDFESGTSKKKSKFTNKVETESNIIDNNQESKERKSLSNILKPIKENDESFKDMITNYENCEVHQKNNVIKTIENLPQDIDKNENIPEFKLHKSINGEINKNCDKNKSSSKSLTNFIKDISKKLNTDRELHNSIKHIMENYLFCDFFVCSKLLKRKVNPNILFRHVRKERYNFNNTEKTNETINPNHYKISQPFEILLEIISFLSIFESLFKYLILDYDQKTKKEKDCNNKITSQPKATHKCCCEIF